MPQIENLREMNGKKSFTVVLDDGTKIHDCKIATGRNGEFVSGPAKKITQRDGTEKWLNLVNFSHATSDAIIAGFSTASAPSALDEPVPF